MHDSDSEELLSDSDQATPDAPAAWRTRAKRKPFAKLVRCSRKAQRQKEALLAVTRLDLQACFTDRISLDRLRRLVELAENEVFVGSNQPVIYWLSCRLEQALDQGKELSHQSEDDRSAANRTRLRRERPHRARRHDPLENWTALKARLKESKALRSATKEVDVLVAASMADGHNEMHTGALFFRHICHTNSSALLGICLFVLQLSGRERSTTLRLDARSDATSDSPTLGMRLMESFFARFEQDAADNYIRRVFLNPMSVCFVQADREGGDRILYAGISSITLFDDMTFDLTESGAASIAIDDFEYFCERPTCFPPLRIEGTALRPSLLESYQRGVKSQPETLFEAMSMFCAGKIFRRFEPRDGALGLDRITEIVSRCSELLPDLATMPAHLLQKLFEVRKCTSCKVLFLGSLEPFVDLWDVEYRLAVNIKPKRHRVAVSAHYHYFCNACLPGHLDFPHGHANRTTSECYCHLCQVFTVYYAELHPNVMVTRVITPDASRTLLGLPLLQDLP